MRLRYTYTAERRAPGLVNFVPAIAYHICLEFHAALTQPGAHILAEPRYWMKDMDNGHHLTISEFRHRMK